MVRCGPLREGDDPGRQLRDLCAQKTVELSDVLKFLDALSASALAEAVVASNGNGKTSLHYAAQLRSGPEGAAVCEALLARRADVDAVTVRGHTPLLFAAGRGHGETVRSLLAARANPRIVSASGDVPWRGGSAALDEETRALLLAAEADEPRPWQDFRQDAEALVAQREYESKSLTSYASTVAASDPEKGELPALVRAVLAALHQEPARLTAALVAATVTDKFALRTALRLCLAAGSEGAAVAVLRACRVTDVRRELAALNPDRRGRMSCLGRLLGALLHELRNPEARQGLSSRRIREAAGPDVLLASEALLLATDPAAGDAERDAVAAELWAEALATLDREPRAFSEAAWAIVGKLQSEGSQGAFARCRHWVLLLRWAVGLGEAATKAQRLDALAGRVRAAGHTATMLTVLEAHRLWLPEHAGEAFREALAPAHSDAAPKVGPEAPEAGARSSLPFFQLAAPPHWVPDAAAVHGLREQLLGLTRGTAGDDGRLRIGIDAEWGAVDGAAAPPSVVQLATAEEAWVLDAACAGQALGELLVALAEQPSAELLGFAFGRDAARLAPLMPGWTAPRLLERVRDLQREVLGAGGATPGLRAVCEARLGLSLDKRLQCSAWDARPLSAAQLAYAAADAQVLVHLAGLQPPVTQS